MLSSGLSVSRLVSVQVSLSSAAESAPAINTALILGSSNTIDAGERMRSYNDITSVASDFDTTTPEFLAAEAWFSQAPRPENVMIGRWFKTAGVGKLVGRPLTLVEQDMTVWNAITDGGFDIHIDGVLAQVTMCDFSAALDLHGVAGIIAATAAMTLKTTWAWNQGVQNAEAFVVYSKTNGVTSEVSFAAPPTGTGTPVDISAMLGMAAADQSGGAYVVPGVATETALAALTIIDAMYSSTFYGVICPEGADTDHQQLGVFCEAADPPHYYGATTADAGCKNPALDTDTASTLSSLGLNRTALQYSSTNPSAIASYLGRILTTLWTGQNTTIDLMYKHEPGVEPETLSATDADTLEKKCCNVYARYANGATMIQHGQSVSGVFTDTIIGADAFAGDIQAALFNVMYTSTSKVPQTDPGMQLLLNAATVVCANYASNGYLGSGNWDAPGFGTLKTGALMPMGYYVYAPSILSQTAADRAARKAPVMMIAGKTAGAIESADVQIFINQ